MFPSQPVASCLSRFPQAARAAAALLAVLTLPAAAEEPRPLEAEPETSFLRLSRDGEEPVSLDTAIVRYARPAAEGKPGVEVDLVAAVHVGNKGYYTALNRLFRDYDAVLYELVAPEGARVPRAGQKPKGAIGTAQQGLTDILGLEFQLAAVDYSPDNFVHADLSPREFAAAMKKRGESWWTMFSRLLSEGMARAERDAAAGSRSEVTFGDLFGLLFAENREVRLRRIMAEQFTDMEVLTAAFGGEEGSTIISDRNAAAIDELRTQLARGRRKIAIFYGAAHMPDFDERLRKDFGLVPGEPTWLEAWDLRLSR